MAHRLLLTIGPMSGSLIKERNVLENEFASQDPFIDRWSATAQPASFYIKWKRVIKGLCSAEPVIDVPTGECREATQ